MKAFLVLLVCFLPLWVGFIDVVLWFFSAPFSIVNWNVERFFVTVGWSVVGWVSIAAFGDFI